MVQIDGAFDDGLIHFNSELTWTLWFCGAYKSISSILQLYS